MSKIDFSKNMNDSLYNKIKSLLYMDYSHFFNYDEYFELALCLSYMTLSKEKIIKKEIQNTDRLGRLTKLVDESEINKLFDKNFSSEIPIIESSKENNYVWILDNIRDCIMHGAFDIDEENKLFLIDNNQFDREIKAKIPFSWFVKYTKNDILSKKKSYHWTMKGFYYNSEKIDFDSFKTKSEIFRNIMYRINISSNIPFNIDEVKNKILNIFDEVSKRNISDELILKYKDKYPHRFNYSDKYLASFAIASDIVKDSIKKEYPNLNIKIILDDKKYKLVQKINKHLPKTFSNYDLAIKRLNENINPKSYELLDYIQKILMNLEVLNCKNDSYQFNTSNYEIVNKFYNIIQTNLSTRDNANQYKHVSQLLFNILINIYGLTTLVINHNELYNDEFLNKVPSELLIKATNKQPIIEYEKNRKIFLKGMLDVEIQLYKLKYESGEMTKSKEKKIRKLEMKLNEKKTKYNMEPPISVKREEYYKLNEKIECFLEKYLKDFYATSSVEVKEKIKDIILNVYDKKIENEIKYTSAIVDNMSETLTIIRNSFSHIGRIYVGKHRDFDTIIIMHDYDNNHAESGQVITTLGTMINLLSEPFYSDEFKKIL